MHADQHRKAVSETLWIIVSVIVVVIVAIVILTIFGNNLGPLSTITEARNNCRVQAQNTCSSAGSLPVAWSTEFRVADGTVTSCQTLLGYSTCPPEWRPPS